MGLLLFGTAGTTQYWQAWVSLSVFFAVIAGDVLVAIGFYFIFPVYRENTFTSATIEVAVDRQAILPPVVLSELFQRSPLAA